MSDKTREFLSEYILADVEKAIDQQSTSLHNLRVRTSYLLTFNVALTAFFVGFIYDYSNQSSLMQEFGLPDFIAALLAIVAAACCLFILIPRYGWVFSHSQKEFLRKYVYVDDIPEKIDALATLTMLREKHYLNNRGLLSGLQSAFFFATVAISLQLVFWIIGRI